MYKWIVAKSELCDKESVPIIYSTIHFTKLQIEIEL